MWGALRDWNHECGNKSESIVDKQCQLMIKVEGLAGQHQMYHREMTQRHTFHDNAFFRIKYAS